jgi:hypothetical protein
VRLPDPRERTAASREASVAMMKATEDRFQRLGKPVPQRRGPRPVVARKSLEPSRGPRVTVCTSAMISSSPYRSSSRKRGTPQTRERRQFDAVDPENRLVADELETRWNLALQKVRDLDDRIQRLKAQRPPAAAAATEPITDLDRDVERAWTIRRRMAALTTVEGAMSNSAATCGLRRPDPSRATA